MAKNKVYLAKYYMPQDQTEHVRVVVAEDKEQGQEHLAERLPGAHAITLKRVKTKKKGLYPKIKTHNEKDNDRSVNLGAGKI